MHHEALPNPAPPGPAALRLETRLPDADGQPGQALGLEARDPVARWEAADCPTLLARHLPGAIASLASAGEQGLLVGVLPYPDSPPSSGPQPTLLLFGHHTRTDAHNDQASPDTGAFRLLSPFESDWTASGYQDGVRRVLDYLAAGDAYQVNLAQRFSARYQGDPRRLYEHLRTRHRPPYAAWLDLGTSQILCLSPESFLEVEGRRVLTRPIKGTRPRHADPARDAAVRRDLQDSAKERAENLMIVDLLRNDLGRVCTAGSIRVPSLFAVESFRNVHHLVSTVEGLLQPDAGIPELLAACFPGGSITGAPKRRAMEIIAELEPHPRSIYCGTIFWLTADGHFGSNIAIRTLLARDGLLHCWGGAGIVADSDPAAEYQECLDKVGGFMRESEKMFLKQESSG